MGFLTDLRQAFRQFGARPGFTLAVLVILSVGIGANTATFSFVNGLLIRPLPYPDSEAVVSVGQARTTTEFRRLREVAESFEQLAAYSDVPVVWDGPREVRGARVTPSVFSLLRTPPRLGRLFSAGDAVVGARRVVLLSYRVWTDRFGADPGVIGAAVELNYDLHTVIGVLPDDFQFPDATVGLWMPLVVPPNEPLAGGRSLRTIGRLRPGVSPEEATAEVRTILARPGADGGQSRGVESVARVIRLREAQGGQVRSALLMLAAATGLVLLMACANAAGLLLARGVVRQRELAIRRVLGAGRGLIVRQLLAESVVLSVAGGVIGLAVAAVVVRSGVALGAALVPGNVHRFAAVGLDGGALLFAAGLSVVIGLVFGVAPAVIWSRVDLARTLNEGNVMAAGGVGRLRAHRTQAALVVTQVALAVVLLTGAGLLLRSFVALVTFDLGSDPSKVLTASVTNPAEWRRAVNGGLGEVGVDDAAVMDAENRRSVDTLLLQMDRVTSLPDIDAMALSSTVPIFPSTSIQPIGIVGRSLSSDPREQRQAAIRTVSSGYADVVRLRLRAGRFFTDRDTAGSPRVAVVSESFARRAFGDASAVGQLLVHAAVPSPASGGDDAPNGNETWEIIGVVADVSSPIIPAFFRDVVAGEIYLSIRQPGMDRRSALGAPTLLIRTVGDPLPVIPFLGEVLADVHPWAKVGFALGPMLSRLAVPPRFYALCAGVFAAMALLLAAFGLYGVLSYAVSQRRREIGVRMALGAGRREVILLVVRQGGALVGAGVILGLLAAAASARIVESALFDVTTADPLTYVAVTAVLLFVALLACWLPARRSVRIDPMDALREA